MNKENLKTLKDLSALKKYVGDVEVGISEYSNVVYVEEIKAEAVKWVKEDIEKMNGKTNTIRRWMKRFDLTEEDLK